MELFTLGAGFYEGGTPHYTERDIVDAARALTGWSVDALAAKFTPASFDGGVKTILGSSGNIGMAGNAPLDLIDIIFQQIDRDLYKPRAAVYLCTKLYKFFVQEDPDMD